MIDNTINAGSILGSLGGSALLGIIVIVLAMIVWHLYKEQQENMGTKQGELNKGVKDIRDIMKENLLVSKEQIQGYKDNSRIMVEFIKEHCKNNSERLENLEDKMDKIEDKMDKIEDKMDKNFNYLDEMKKFLKTLKNDSGGK